MPSQANPNASPGGVHSAALLLPWYLSGTLGDGDRALVTAHLAVCAQCCAELEALTVLRRTLRATLAADSRSRRSVRRWRLAAGLAAALVLAQSALILVRYRAPSPSPSPSPATMVASRGLGAPTSRLELELNPSASERALRALLLAENASIVAGPTVDGRYIVELPSTDPARVAAAVERARADGAVVRAAARAP